MNEYNELITLTDENGNQEEFELLDTIDYEGVSYIVLMPTEAEEDEDGVGVVIMAFEPEAEGSDVGTYVEPSEDVADAVFEIFAAKMDEE